MAVPVFVLGLCFAAIGVICLYFGYDLGGTERGVAYTISGSVALSAAGLLAGIATVTARLEALTTLLRERTLRVAPPAETVTPPASIETARPAVADQRFDPPEPVASHPVPPAASTPLAPVLAGGAAAVATAATMNMVFGKESSSIKADSMAEHDPVPPSEPAFDFEQALARELARPQPTIEQPPAADEQKPAEPAALLPDPELWAIRQEPAIDGKEDEAVEVIDHAPAEQTSDPASRPIAADTARPVDGHPSNSDDWSIRLEPELRHDEPTPASPDLPDDVFEDVFADKPEHDKETERQEKLEHQEKPEHVEMLTHEAAAAGHDDPVLTAPVDTDHAHEPEPVEDHHSHAHEKPAAVHHPAEEEPHHEGSLLHSPEPDPDPVEEPHAPPSPALNIHDPALKVIGSYSVGSNNYTMYADGSVEAHTETGLYRFASLDELRQFIEKGTATPAE